MSNKKQKSELSPQEAKRLEVRDAAVKEIKARNKKKSGNADDNNPNNQQTGNDNK